MGILKMLMEGGRRIIPKGTSLSHGSSGPLSKLKPDFPLFMTDNPKAADFYSKYKKTPESEIRTLSLPEGRFATPEDMVNMGFATKSEYGPSVHPDYWNKMDKNIDLLPHGNDWNMGALQDMLYLPEVRKKFRSNELNYLMFGEPSPVTHNEIWENLAALNANKLRVHGLVSDKRNPSAQIIKIWDKWKEIGGKSKSQFKDVAEELMIPLSSVRKSMYHPKAKAYLGDDAPVLRKHRKERPR
tara:strand:+ start:87 stop:812 length:726 start_codon:yes stop_codon:yes gene_type:complete